MFTFFCIYSLLFRPLGGDRECLSKISFPTEYSAGFSLFVHYSGMNLDLYNLRYFETRRQTKFRIFYIEWGRRPGIARVSPFQSKTLRKPLPELVDNREAIIGMHSDLWSHITIISICGIHDARGRWNTWEEGNAPRSSLGYPKSPEQICFEPFRPFSFLWRTKFLFWVLYVDIFPEK